MSFFGVNIFLGVLGYSDEALLTLDLIRMGDLKALILTITPSSIFLMIYFLFISRDLTYLGIRVNLMKLYICFCGCWFLNYFSIP